MEAAFSKFYEYIMTYGLSLLGAIIIFIVGKWLARVISRIAEKVQHAGYDPHSRFSGRSHLAAN